MIGGEFSGADIHEACPSACYPSWLLECLEAQLLATCGRAVGPRLGPLAFVDPPG